MESKLQRDVRFLKAYSLITTLLFGAFIISAFTPQNQKQNFEEINVERINIVEKDGQLRMVISNRERQHPGQVDGKLMKRENGRPPGLIFFNHKGDECGGLIFDENGGKGHFVSLTFDKTRQDQTIGIQHLEGDNGQYFAGLRIWDRPEISLPEVIEKIDKIKQLPDAEQEAAFKKMDDAGELGQARITVGKMRDKSVSITLSDTKGHPRIKIAVDEKDNPRLDFLDKTGAVVYSLPNQQ